MLPKYRTRIHLRHPIGVKRILGTTPKDSNRGHLVHNLRHFNNNIRPMLIRGNRGTLPNRLPRPPRRITNARKTSPNNVNSPRFLNVVNQRPLRRHFRPLNINYLNNGPLPTLYGRRNGGPRRYPLSLRLMTERLNTINVFRLPRTNNNLRVTRIIQNRPHERQRTPTLRQGRVFLNAGILYTTRGLRLGGSVFMFRTLPFNLPRNVRNTKHGGGSIPRTNQTTLDTRLRRSYTPLSGSRLRTLLPIRHRLQGIPQGNTKVRVRKGPRNAVLLNLLREYLVLRHFASQ